MKKVFLSILCAGFGVLFFIGATLEAGEISGTVKKIDAAKKTITITVEGKDKTLPVSKDVSITSVSSTKDKKGKDVENVATLDSLSAVTIGAKVKVLTETQDDKDIITAMKIEGGQASAKTTKKKKKN